MTKNNAWNTDFPAGVANGMTGDASVTANAVLCGGTTSTGPLQSIASVGTYGQLLTSNGASALPTMQNNAVTTGKMYLLKTTAASGDSSIEFKSLIGTYFVNYVMIISQFIPGTDSAYPRMEWSTDNGGSYLSSGYISGVNTQVYNSATIGNANNTALIYLSGTVNGVDNGGYYNAYIEMYNLASSNQPSLYAYMYYTGGDGSVRLGTAFASNSTASGVNAIRMTTNTGTFSGRFSLYGVGV